MPLKRDPSLIPLSHDHHHALVRVFEIRQAIRAGASLEAQCKQTLDYHRHELAPHFRAEEEVLVPVLRRSLGDETSVRRLIDDHRALEHHIAAVGSGSDSLTAFADLLEAHVRFEERELFAAYQECVPTAERAEVEAGIRRILGR